MKAVLSNRIYLSVDFDLLDELDQELTYRVPNPLGIDKPSIVIKNLHRIKDNLVSIPSGREDLIPPNYEIKDKRILNPVEFPEFKHTLRPSQQAIYDQLVDSAIINAPPSWGKTFTAIAIAAKLGQKTLVVTHNTGLREQWIKEIKSALGMEPGIIGSGAFKISPDIVVGNTQSLYNNVPQISKEFGTLIMDEMHHVPSATFSKVIDSNYARYKIGLSGTIKRKDGKHVVFEDYFKKNNIFKPPKENFMQPEAHIIRTDIRFPGTGGIPWAIRINELTRMNSYRELVCVLAATYAKKGHKVLVLSDRVEFLRACNAVLEDISVCVTGETDQRTRNNLSKTLKEKQVIFGTQVIFSEGISINELSCLILGTPVNNEPLLEQLIGRITRKKENKRTPAVVDIWLKGPTMERQAQNRLGHYMREGYRVKYF